eukprot:Anaeramoba_ignava/a222470_24.p1 GENE.a222470_24~~a222470_24.p1  ORF type:complete len:666 (-),score=182.22 a222470_24:165-2162(-)
MNKLVFFFLLSILLFLFVDSVTLKNYIELPLGMQSTRLSLIDSQSHYVYFVSSNDEVRSFLFKFDTLILEFVEKLDLGQNEVYCGVVDTNTNFGYFGTDNSEGYIIKVDLTGMSVIGSIQVSGGGNFKTAQIDPTNHYAYFISYDPPIPDVFKIDLNSFTQVGSLTVSSDYRYGSAIDLGSQKLYIIGYSSNTTIYTVDLANFVSGDSLALEQDDGRASCAVIDTTTGQMYLGTATQPPKVIKVDLTSFSRVGSYLMGDYYSISHAAIDIPNSFAYFLVEDEPYLLKFNLASSSLVGDLKLNSSSARSMSFNQTNQTLFIGMSGSQVIKVNVQSMNKEDYVVLPDYENPKTILIDEAAQIAYVGFYTNFALNAKINLTSLEILDYLITEDPEQYILYGEIDLDNEVVYYFTYEGLTIIKINISDFSISEIKEISAPGGSNGTLGTAFDNQTHFLYVGFQANDNNTIFKFNSPDLTLVDELNLGEKEIRALSIHSSQGFLYVAYRNYSTGYFTLLEILLSSFTENRNLNLSDYVVDTLLLDTKHDYLYLGTNTDDSVARNSVSAEPTFAEICRIDLSSLMILDCNQLQNVDTVEMAVLSSNQDYAYFFTHSSTSKVFEVTTYNNVITSSQTFDSLSFIEAAATDSTHQMFYVSTDDAPVIFAQFSD